MVVTPSLAAKHEAKQPHETFTTRRKVAIGIAGASVISVVTGAVLGTTAKGQQSDAFKLCPNLATPCTQADQSNALLQSSRSRALAANITFAITAATAIGAGILWFTGAPNAENTTRVSVIPSLALAPNASSVVVLGRF